MKVAVSAGMLWPERRTVRLAGKLRLVEELRVRDLASVEAAFAEIAGHPHKGYEDSLAVIANKAAHSREDVIHHGMRLMDSRDWPPKVGSDRFNEILASPEGIGAFLWVVLNRTDPSLSETDIPVLYADARDGEIDEVSCIAWGYQPWESFDPDDGPTDGGTPSAWQWGSHVHKLCSRGLSYDAIGAMYLSQFLNEIAEGEPRKVRLRPLSPA